MLGIKSLFIVGGIIGIVGLAGAGYWYVSNLQVENEKLTTQNIRQQSVITEQNEAYEKLLADVDSKNSIIADLNAQRLAAERSMNVLQDKLARHDLEMLAATKPKQVARIVTKGIADYVRCVEIASGSPLTDKEKSATLPSEINSSCWDIANPMFNPDAQSTEWKRRNLK